MVRRNLSITALVLCCLVAVAKERPLIGIILFQGDSGPAYAQVTGVQLNGKNEVYVCSVNAPLTNDTYKKQPKTQLSLATALERGTDGVLTMTTAGHAALHEDSAGAAGSHPGQIQLEDGADIRSQSRDGQRRQFQPQFKVT